jgi:hypothetical protein
MPPRKNTLVKQWVVEEEDEEEGEVDRATAAAATRGNCMMTHQAHARRNTLADHIYCIGSAEQAGDDFSVIPRFIIYYGVYYLHQL